MKLSKINKKFSIDKATILSKALPFMQRYAGKNITIKFGGSAMGEKNFSHCFAKDIVLLKQVGINPIVVHGGGPKIREMLDKLGVKTDFINGLRVTDKETINIVEMILSGSINKEIVMEINKEGGMAIGLSGKGYKKPGDYPIGDIFKVDDIEVLYPSHRDTFCKYLAVSCSKKFLKKKKSKYQNIFD